MSNYASDIFTPIFDEIRRLTGARAYTDKVCVRALSPYTYPCASCYCDFVGILFGNMNEDGPHTSLSLTHTHAAALLHTCGKMPSFRSSTRTPLFTDRSARTTLTMWTWRTVWWLTTSARCPSPSLMAHALAGRGRLGAVRVSVCVCERARVGLCVCVCVCLLGGSW